MDLLQILNNILLTKNEIRDILGENDNIARYAVSIHNLLARQYNVAYRQGFHDRYYILTGEDRWVTGPQEILEYNINPQYYEAFTTEVLTDIMRDVLNYRLNMKDELNVFIEPDIDDNFQEYPDYLRGIIDRIIQIGADDGIAAADEAYEGNSDVNNPTFSYSSNRFTITSDQDEACIYYSLGATGVPTVYTGPVIISEPVDVYVWAKIGRSESEHVAYSCTISSDGWNAFVWPPTVFQEDNKIYMSATGNPTIQYCIDDGDWYVYFGPVAVSEGMSVVKAMSVKDNEYSKYTIQPLSFEQDIDSLRPANVRCTITDNGDNRTVTLTCETTGANIYYCIDEADGYYRNYSNPFTVESDHFLVYTYARKDGYESKMRLVYKWDANTSTTIPEDVQFIDEGTSVTLHTSTAGARVHYRYGPVGSFTETSSNAISLTPADITDIYAYATLNGVSSRNQSRYTFRPKGTTTAPPKPTMIQQGNIITISSPYDVKYTTDQTDPRTYGKAYNKQTGIGITEFTVIKAVAVYNNVYSAIATGSFSYDSSSQGGESGSQGGGQGGGSNNGTPSDESFVAGNWFAVSGATAMTFSGTDVMFATASDSKWINASSSSISGLNPNVKTYFKGSINSISGFTGNAVISGDISSIKGGTIGAADKNLSGMFANCSGLYNASGIIVNISNMPNGMMERMFQNCKDLHEAAFEISTNTVSENGMSNMFAGCNNMVAGPRFTFTAVGNSGMYRCFYGCSKLASVGSLNLSSAGTSAFSSCFYGCTEMTSFSLTSPTGTAPNYVFDSMFYSCSALNDASRISINYDTMSTSSCANMFYGTTALRTPPVISATTMGASCYAHMFERSGIDTPPILPATTLANSCYDSMFRDCINLQSSPDLMVENVYGYAGCYKQMFYGCSRLNHIKAMIKNLPGTYTTQWVYGVADSGTFEANSDAGWSSVPRGVDSVPTNWTVTWAKPVGLIKDIIQESGFVRILASNSDEIWYCLTDTNTQPADSAFIQYTGQFQLSVAKYVWARCKNSDGVWGPVYVEYINPAYPDLVISCRDHYVTINTGGIDFNYDYIQYQICAFQDTSTVTQNWTTYSQPFLISTDVTIVAKGYVNGNAVTTTTQDILYDTSSPAIWFGILMNGTRTAIVRCWAYLSYPQPAELNSLWYKIDDTVADNPDTAPSKWTKGTQVELQQFVSSSNEMVTVCAIAKVSKNSGLVWSPMVAQEMHKNATESFKEVKFVLRETETNDVVLEYGGTTYDTWDMPDTVIEYKKDLGGAVKQYSRYFNMFTAFNMTGGTQTVNIYGRAKVGHVYELDENDQPKWYLSALTYNPAYVRLDLADPVPYAYADGEKVYIKVDNNTTGLPSGYSLVNYYKIEVLAYDASGLRPTGSAYNDYVPYSNPVLLDSHVTEFKVWAYSAVMVSSEVTHRTNEVSSKAYNIKTDFGIMWDYRPVLIITVDPTTYKVTIENPKFDAEPMIKVVTDADSWGIGTNGPTLNPHKYDIYKYATAISFGRVSTRVYEGYLDPALATGTIYAYYTYEGLDSEPASQNYKNNSVQPVLAPTVTYSWDRHKQAYILLVQQPSNPGARFYYRMENCVWSGGVVNEHKYDDRKTASYYGDTIDQYLIEADIYGITSYGDIEKESDPVHFVNEYYTRLDVPTILIVEKTNNNAVKVVNNNPLATNYWRLKEGTGVWNLSALDTTKYDNWMIAFKTENDLDTNLLSGTFEAYSEWGSENTLDELVELDYDTGATINDTPPTITVTEDSENEIYNVTITNNADRTNFNNILWKIDELVWSDVPDTDNMYTKYMSDTNGRWKFVNNQASYTFTIGKDVASGKITAFATSSPNALVTTINRSNNTAVTIVEFTNALV